MANVRSKELEIKKIENISAKLTTASSKTVKFFESKLLNDSGSYGNDVDDISCYYKSPMMFLSADNVKSAKLMLQHIKNKYMLANGDFSSAPEKKSIKPELEEYWGYTNGWIIRAAQKVKFDDMSELGYRFLDRLYAGEKRGFLTNNINSGNRVTDILMTAHLGLLNLEKNNMDFATSSGYYLCHAIEKQPCLDKGIYLRFDSKGFPITDFTNETAPFYFVDKIKPDQLYFMIGYPSAYLALLYDKTKNKMFLDNAKAYLDFAISCDENVYKSNFSHKLAWAASLLYDITGDEKYLAVIEKITDHFLSLQGDNGMWYLEADKYSAYDQSAEIACWFIEISKNINSYKNKIDSSNILNNSIHLFAEKSQSSPASSTNNEKRELSP